MRRSIGVDGPGGPRFVKITFGAALIKAITGVTVISTGKGELLPLPLRLRCKTLIFTLFRLVFLTALSEVSV